MIKVFSATDKIFSFNGDAVLKAVKAKVHKEDNDDYYWMSMLVLNRPLNQ